MKRRNVFLVAVVVAVVGGLVAAPRRYVVDGVSMGPGLLPGDVVASGWLPAFDRWRPPVRFDRWILTLPDGSTGLKRVAGLPGETIAIVDGDLVVDGQTLLKGPRLLAAMGSDLGAAETAGFSWRKDPAEILDDAPFAAGEVSRLLLPVHDAGFAAEVAVAAGPVRVWATAGPLTVTWRLGGAGRYAMVAGRLDGQAVAVAWPVADGGPAARGRRCLPPAMPDRWDVARPWPVAAEAGDDRSPPLALSLVVDDDSRATLERVTTWRDARLRTAADGVARWEVAPDEVFVLGDFPSGSRDSRHFGSLPLTALQRRLGP